MLVALLVIVAALGLAGCASNGDPTKYTQEVKDNFSRACTEGLAGSSKISNAEQYCSCVIDKFSGPVSSDKPNTPVVAFSKFKDFDAELRTKIDKGEIKSFDDISKQYPQYAPYFTDCVSAGPAAPK